SDFEITLDKPYLYSENDINGNSIIKEKTILTIKRIAYTQELDNVKLSFDNLYFLGNGFYQGPWGYWDGAYAYRIFEPGQWSDASYGTEYPQEEFRSNTPFYYYRTRPEGEVDSFSIGMEVEKSITAEAVSQEVGVGTKKSKVDYTKFVKEVKLNNQLIEADKYTVELVNNFPTNKVGVVNAKVRVAFKSDPSITVDVDVPCNVKWEESIVFGTRQAVDVNATPFKTASTLILNNNNGNLTIKNGVGNAANESGDISTGLIIDYGQNRVALQANLYSMVSSNYLTDSNKYLTHSALGSESVFDVTGRLDSPQTVKQGDILQAYSNVRMNDGTSKPRIRHMNEYLDTSDVKEGQNQVFYQITNDGYKILHFNHLDNTKRFEISTVDTKESLENKLNNKEFLKNDMYPSVEIVKFSKYPDNSKDGNSQGSIQVKEKLINGNYVYYNYEVQFLVKEELTAKAKKQTINLGSNFDNVSPYDLVTEVKLGNKKLTKDDYNVAIQNGISTDKIGSKTAKIKVTLKSDISKTLDLDVPVEILWGYTIGSNNIVYSSSTGFSLSLITEDKPNIVATLGNGGNSRSWINDHKDGTYITTKIYKDSQLLNSEKNLPYINLAVSGRDSAESATNRWNNLSNLNEVSYGDILQYDVLTTWGDNKWIMREEAQKYESLGNQSIYYEVTKKGYKTLHLNHLGTKDADIPIYSTKDYLDAHINDYIDLKGYSNINVKEFSEYPNTKASGPQKGKIVVEETLTTGKKVQYEYEVTINVEPGTLNFTVPKTLTFNGFSKSKSERVIHRAYSGNLGLSIKDNRGQGKQGNWRLTAQVNRKEELAQYLVFRGVDLKDKYLNQGATEIYSQSKQSNPTEPLEVEVSGKWTKDTGILLKIPSKNNLSSQNYSTIITWNLVEGP
ncbi:hypothetical protein GP419_002604, partial [Enterococcus faecalis]|nr:hypothetical protein [Enterococcus faecalis]